MKDRKRILALMSNAWHRVMDAQQAQITESNPALTVGQRARARAETRRLVEEAILDLHRIRQLQRPSKRR